MIGILESPGSSIDKAGAKSEMNGEISALTPSVPSSKLCPRLRRTAIRRRVIALSATCKAIAVFWGARNKVCLRSRQTYIYIYPGPFFTIFNSQSQRELPRAYHCLDTRMSSHAACHTRHSLSAFTSNVTHPQPVTRALPVKALHDMSRRSLGLSRVG